MKIIGLDLSLRSTGIVVWDMEKEKMLEYSTFKPKVFDVERLSIILDEILRVVLKFHSPGEFMVVIEGYAMGVRGGRTFSIGELGGLVKHKLYKMSVPYLVVPPKTLKKYATGNGNADKPKMATKLLSDYGIELDDDNQVDAFWLTQFGADCVEGHLVEEEIAIVDMDENKIFRKYLTIKNIIV